MTLWWGREKGSYWSEEGNNEREVELALNGIVAVTISTREKNTTCVVPSMSSASNSIYKMQNQKMIKSGVPQLLVCGG